MEEIAGECIVLFDPADPRDIADKVASLYAGAIDTQALLAHREAVLSRFSWESTAAKDA